MIPPIVETVHDGIRIVRDDLLLGGSKVRVVAPLMASTPVSEWVYAGPATGYAQVALAVGSVATGIPATFFTPKRKRLTDLSTLAAGIGLRIVEVPAGRLSVLRARARSYSDLSGGTLVPVGLRFPGSHAAFVDVARSVDPPRRAFVAVGSGTFSAALADAWPDTQIVGVRVGMKPEVTSERVDYIDAPEDFADDATGPTPPIPSVSNYDAKVWRFVVERAEPGDLWWNIGGPPPSVEMARSVLAGGSLRIP